MRRARQRWFPFIEEAANHIALSKVRHAGQPLGRKTRWGGVAIATSNAAFRNGAFAGFRNSSGRIYFLCPFHREKTPSCLWTPERRRFHCFGCNKSGTALELSNALRFPKPPKPFDYTLDPDDELAPRDLPF